LEEHKNPGFSFRHASHRYVGRYDRFYLSTLQGIGNSEEERPVWTATQALIVTSEISDHQPIALEPTVLVWGPGSTLFLAPYWRKVGACLSLLLLSFNTSTDSSRMIDIDWSLTDS